MSSVPQHQTDLGNVLDRRYHQPSKKAKSSLMFEFPYTSMFEGYDQYKWSVFRDLPAEKMYELMQTEIFPFIKNRRLPIKVS